jgi:hypothetical protein
MKVLLLAVLSLVALATNLPAAGRPKYSATVITDYRGKRETEKVRIHAAPIFDFRISRASFPHRTLFELHPDKKKHEITVSGAWLGKPITIPSRRVEFVSEGEPKKKSSAHQIVLNPSQERAFLALHVLAFVGLHEYAQLKSGRARSLQYSGHRRGDVRWILQPGLHGTNRVILRNKDMRFEMRIAPHGREFVPAPLDKRKAASIAAFDSRS